jgi:cell division septation protein DedD
MTQPFQFANGQVAYSAEDLLELCKQFPDDGTNYLVREDLEKWLAYIGKNDIAQCAATARQTALEDRQKLEEFLNKCHALSSPEQESAVPQPPIVSESSVVETVETEPAVPEQMESPVIEQQKFTPVTPESTPQPTSVPKSSETSVNSKSTGKKPSFLRIIARLVVNVLYRNRN